MSTAEKYINKKIEIHPAYIDSIRALCKAAFDELRGIKKDAHSIDQFDLHQRSEWAMARLDSALGLLEIGDRLK